jgi:hypothetical protein
MRNSPLAIHRYILLFLPSRPLVRESYESAAISLCPILVRGIPHFWASTPTIPITEFLQLFWKISPNGDWIAVGGQSSDSDESQIGLWNVWNRIGFQWRYCKHDNCFVNHLSFHEGSSKLKVCCWSGLTCIWDISELHHNKTPEWQQEYDEVIKWSEDGSWVVLSGRDQDESLRLYDTTASTWTKLLDVPHLNENKTSRLIPFFVRQLDGKSWVALRIFEENDKYPACSLIRFWDWSSGRRIRSCMDDLYIPIDRTLHPTKNYDVSRDGKYIVFYARLSPTTTFHNIHVCSCEHGEVRRLWSSPDIEFKRVTLKFFSQEGELMLLVANKGDDPVGNRLSVFAALNGSLLKVRFPESFPFKIETSINDSYAAMEDKDETCSIIRTDSLEILDSFQLRVFGFSTDPDSVVVGLSGNQLLIYPTESSRDFEDPIRDTDKILSMDCSPNNMLIASEDQSGLLVIWEVTSGERLHEYQMDGELNMARFSNDSSLLLLLLRGEGLEFIYVLDIASYKLTEIWTGQYLTSRIRTPDANCLDAIFFPQTNRIASIHIDGIFRIFFFALESPEVRSFQATIDDPKLTSSTGEQIIISNNEEYIAIYQQDSKFIHYWPIQANSMPFSFNWRLFRV